MFDCKCNDKREDRKFHQYGSVAFMICSTTLVASCEMKIYMIHKNLTLHEICKLGLKFMRCSLFTPNEASFLARRRWWAELGYSCGHRAGS